MGLAVHGVARRGRVRSRKALRQPKASGTAQGERKVNRAWMEGFWERPSPPIWLALKQSNRMS